MQQPRGEQNNHVLKNMRRWIMSLGMLSLAVAGSAQAATDHTGLITVYEGSKTCRNCHPGAVEEVLDSIHYKLMGQVQDVYNMFTNRPVEGIHGKGNRY